MPTAIANTTDTNTQVTSAPAGQQSKPDFGNGRYSPLMQECWEDSQVIFRLDSDKSAKLARQIGTEVGALMRNTPVTVKTGKPNDDQRLTISEAAKLKNVTMTPAITALRALHWANDAVKNGFSRRDTRWTVHKNLHDYFESL